MADRRDRNQQREPQLMLELKLDFNVTISSAGGMSGISWAIRRPRLSTKVIVHG
jgi:hypothetical protein